MSPGRIWSWLWRAVVVVTVPWALVSACILIVASGPWERSRGWAYLTATGFVVCLGLLGFYASAVIAPDETHPPAAPHDRKMLLAASVCVFFIGSVLTAVR